MSEALRIGLNLKPWENRVQQLMDSGARIFTFRGAGSINGIEPGSCEKAVVAIRDRILAIREQGIPVALMYDGDGDNRAKPDIGVVFGKLADLFHKDKGVVVIAAQTEGWYGPPTEKAPIKSASGTLYETFVFGDALEGKHASLTQSAALAAYKHYEQFFVGPAGQIAFSQLQDLSEKAASHRSADLPLKVTVFGTSNNSTIGEELERQLKAAEGNDQLIGKITPKLEQRKGHPYGFLFTPDGEFNVDASKYPGISFAVVKFMPAPK